jgi:hypothetical protein
MAYPKSLFMNRQAVIDPSGRYNTPSREMFGTRDGKRNKYGARGHTKGRIVWGRDGRFGSARATGDVKEPYTFKTF